MIIWPDSRSEHHSGPTFQPGLNGMVNSSHSFHRTLSVDCDDEEAK